MRTLTDAEADRHAAEIDERGYTIVEDAFDATFATEVLDALDAVIQERQLIPAGNGFEGRDTYRVYNLLAHDPLFRRIPTAPAVLPVVERVLDAECLLSTLSSIDIRPGESAQPIHSDDQVIGLPRTGSPVVCNSMWAITDFTEAKLGVPRHIAATFDERLARLCGYGTYHGLIGHIDKTDPLRLLERHDADDTMLWDAG